MGIQSVNRREIPKTTTTTTSITTKMYSSLTFLTSSLLMVTGAPGGHYRSALKAKDVPHGTTPVKTAGGEEIEVTRNRYINIKSSAGEAGVIAFDILATN